MSDLSDQETLKSQYEAKVAADLARNAQERERITAEVAALRGQLTTLEHDNALLLGVQQALAAEAARSAAPTAVEPESADGATPEAPAAPKEGKTKVPGARKPKSAAAPRKRQSGRTPKAAAKKPAATKGPTLGQLARKQLSQHREPRSAAEVTAALAAEHPERRVNVNVVRNTLEALVAKGVVYRTKQKKSVFYSDAGTASAEAAAGEGVPAAAQGS